MRKGVFLPWQRTYVCLTVILVVGFPWPTALGEGLLPETVPPVLLSSPVNATWAANHLSYWQGKGIRGFLLSGIQDDLETDLWARDGDPDTTRGDDHLLREVRLAVERLSSAGIDRNFALVPLAPEAAYFTDPSAAAGAVARLEEAAVFCRLSGLRGVALDTCATSLFYDYRWDGYARDRGSLSGLDAGAQALGRRAVRAVLRAYPDAEILVIAEGYAARRPLWHALFRGMAEAVAPARTQAFHVLTRETLLEADPRRLEGIVRRTRRLLRHGLDGDARAWWQRHGSVAVGVGPLGYRDVPEGRSSVAFYPIEAFRVQVAAAKLLSDHYVWIDAGGPTWWRLTEQEAETYAGLLQNGGRIPAQTGPVVEDLLAYTVRTPFDSHRRVGPYAFGDLWCHVLHTRAGAGVVFWEGVPDDTVLADQAIPVSMTELRTGKRHGPASTEALLSALPSRAPVFVEPLPVRSWVLPASLWMAIPEPPVPSSRSVDVAFGFSGRSGFRVAGTLEAVAPAGLAVSPRRHPFEIENGEEMQVRGKVRGRFRLGDVTELRLGLVVPGSLPVTRSFRMSVCPDLLWRRGLDGAAGHGLVAADLDAEPPAEILACTEAGEVVCLEAGGAPRWKRRFPAAFGAPPAVVRDASGGALVVTLDQRGRLRALFEDGRVAWEKELAPPAHAQAPVPSALDEEPGDEILVATEDGGLIALTCAGDGFWSHGAGAPGCWFTAMQAPGGPSAGVFVVAAADSGRTLDRVDGSGARVWRAGLDGAPCCAPAFADLDADGVGEVLTLTASGVVQGWEAGSGRQVAHHLVPEATAPRGLMVQELLPEEGPEILFIETAGLRCYSSAFERLWRTPVGLTAAPVVAHLADGPRILAPTQEEGLVCLDRNGQVLWRDSRAAVPLAGTPLVVDAAPNGGPTALYADRSRCVRAIVLE